MIRTPFLTQLGPNDVLIGRGAPSNVNEGNRRFRELVLSRKDEYVAAAKRQVKNQIAREIVHTITHLRRGNFVRRVESLVEAEELGIPEGMNAWAFVPLETAVQKTKQALRDQAVASAKGGEHAAAASSSPPTISAAREGATTVASAADAYKRQKFLAQATGQQPADSGMIGDYLRLARDARVRATSLHPSLYQQESLRADTALGLQYQLQQQLLNQPPPHQQMIPHMLPSTLPLSSTPMSYLGHDVRAASAFAPQPPHPMHASLFPTRSPHPDELAAAAIFGQPELALHPAATSGFVPHRLAARPGRSRPPQPTAFQRVLSSDIAARRGVQSMQYASTEAMSRGTVAAATAASRASGRRSGTQVPSPQPSVSSQASQSSASSSSPSPTSSSVVVRDESTGEAALRVAVEMATGVRPKHPRQEFLELTHSEMHMLSAACALGIPTFPSETTPSGQGRPDPAASLTWEQVAAAIDFVASRWNESPPSPLPPTSVARAADRTPRRQGPSREEGKHEAGRHTQARQMNPKELVKTMVLLLGRVRSFGMSSGVSDQPLPLQPKNYEVWFLDELRRYVPTLDHLVVSQLETKRPALAATDSTMTGLMDREDCRAVYAQVSCLSRLRALFGEATARDSSFQGSATASSWQAQVVAAASECDKTQTWTSRPGWWVTSVPSSSSDEDDRGGESMQQSGDDVALLDMVLRDAVLSSEDVSPLQLTTTDESKKKGRAGSERDTGASASLQQLGLSKAAVQDRVAQLVEQLHRQHPQGQ